MNNFSYWIEQIADIPAKDETGAWVDLETGLHYDASIDYAKGTARVRRTVGAKAMEAREIAKAFGGKALKGSAKQKEWAEKIRAEKLAEMDEDQAEMACDPNGLLTHSKFWIDNRGVAGANIGAFVQEQKALLKQYRAAQSKVDAVNAKAIAEQYNALTSTWGF